MGGFGVAPDDGAARDVVGGAVGPGPAGDDGAGDVEGEGAFAAADRADEQGEETGRKPAGPVPEVRAGSGGRGVHRVNYNTKENKCSLKWREGGLPVETGS